MRSFDLTEQIERLVRAGMPRIQRMAPETYRGLWPKSVDLPTEHEGRFDRALCVDAFPLHPMRTAVDRGDRRATPPCRLLPLPGLDKPTSVVFDEDVHGELDPLPHPKLGDLLRYVIFWQAGERYKGWSPNAMRSRFADDECGLRLNEGLHLPLQEEDLVRKRRIPLVAHMYDRGETYFAHWVGRTPTFALEYGMFAELDGVPSRAKDVIPVSTEHRDFFLKG